MQISRSHPYLLPSAVQAPQRERAASENQNLPVSPQSAEASRATRTIEDIRSAERILDRRQSQNTYAYTAQEGRQQRAAAAYQSLQQSDERAYVSEVLGIDVYA